MSRLAIVVLFLLPTLLRAESFDLYINPLLNKVPKAEGVKELKELTPALITENDRVLKDAAAALIVVRTNDDRNCKLLVQAARQKIDDQRTLRILVIERYVTYRDGSERTIHSTGKNVVLYPGFRMNLDLGQVVPEDLSADLRFVVAEDKVYLEPVKNAKLYLLTKPMAEATPAKTEKLIVGEKFETRYYNGTYKLYDDGRRSGSLALKVDAEGEITGTYTSDKDGQNYDVKGKVGSQQHAVSFTIKFPRTEQVFTGFLFTGDGKALTGSSRLLEREAGFYALRVED